MNEDKERELATDARAAVLIKCVKSNAINSMVSLLFLQTSRNRSYLLVAIIIVIIIIIIS
jgi:hypothetical protein